MKFIKGMFIGSMISTITAIVYYESTNMDKKKLMKKGKKFIKKFDFSLM